MSRRCAHIAIATALIALAGCARAGSEVRAAEPTSSPVRHHLVSGLCDQLDHRPLEDLVGSPAKARPGPSARPGRIAQSCVIAAGSQKLPFGSVDLFVKVKDTAELAEADMPPKTAPTQRGYITEGELDGLGDRARFYYCCGRHDEVGRNSFDITVRENAAVVTVRLVLYTPERVERPEMEATARAYASQTLDLIRVE